MPIRNLHVHRLVASAGRQYRRRSDRSWTWLASAVGRAARHLPTRRSTGCIVLVPAADSAGLGNQGVVEATAQHLAELGHQTLLTSWDRPRAAGCPTLRAGRGAVPLAGWLRLRRLRPGAVMILGGNTMDGHRSDWVSARTWGLALFAHAAGIPTSVVGVGWDAPGECGVGAVRAACATPPSLRVSCRDEVSARRLAAVTGRPVVHGADLAFLLVDAHPSPSPAAVDALEAIPAHWRRVVVNVDGGGLGPVQEHDALIEKVGAQLATVENDHIATLLVPYGLAGSRSDVVWAEAILGSARRHGAHFAAVVVPATVGDTAAIVAAVDAVVTGRACVGIVALGVGTPVRAMDHHGNLEGLEAWFAGCELAVRLAPDDFLATSGDLVLEVLARSVPEREAIARALPAVRAAAARLIGGAVDGLPDREADYVEERSSWMARSGRA